MNFLMKGMKKRIMFFVLFVILSAGTLGITLASAPPPLDLIGYVKINGTSTPIEGAKVELYVYDFMSGWIFVGTEYTDSSGKYTFEDVPFGARKVHISKSGYNSYEGVYQQTIYLSLLSYEYTFYGQIYDKITGQLLSGATVEVKHGSTTKSHTTDNSGCYNIVFSFSSSGSRTFERTVSKTLFEDDYEIIVMNYGWEHVDIYMKFEKLAGIVVESNMWSKSAIQTAISQYEQDLENQGFRSIRHTNTISSVEDLRSLLQTWYTDYGIDGATLIGDLPHAYYWLPEIPDTAFSEDTFICDLFIMDLDGTWMDSDSDGVYDQHTNGNGDIQPEIYVGRIDPSKRTFGIKTNKGDILMLLDRIHSFRTGGVSRTHRALSYIDDDWVNLNWEDDISLAYTNNVVVNDPEITNGFDWLSRLDDDYEWAHLCCHSGPTVHQFQAPSGGEAVNSYFIHLMHPSFNFYNLFCCSAANWDENNCLAVTYLFSGTHSLTVIGATKTGGMTSIDHFYDQLPNGKTIGYAFYNWFQNVGLSSLYNKHWSYGMVILGDPFLTTI